MVCQPDSSGLSALLVIPRHAQKLVPPAPIVVVLEEVLSSGKSYVYAAVNVYKPVQSMPFMRTKVVTYSSVCIAVGVLRFVHITALS